jgi:hypothetical protein
MRPIRTLQKTKEFRQLLMDKQYISSAVIRMNSRFTAHGLSIIGSYIALFTIITMIFVAIARKSDFSINEITMVSAAVSMTNRLSGYITLITKDFSSFSSNANIALKVIFDKLLKILPII